MAATRQRLVIRPVPYCATLLNWDDVIHVSSDLMTIRVGTLAERVIEKLLAPRLFPALAVVDLAVGFAVGGLVVGASVDNTSPTIGSWVRAACIDA